MNEEIVKLFNKATALKRGQKLYTTFGPDTYYIIQKNSFGELEFAEHRNKWSFQKDGYLLYSFVFATPEQLYNGIVSRPEMYAYNHFSHTLKHFDNWINMVKAFSVVRQKRYETNDKKLPDYYYEKVKKYLVVSK
jgi:hypothetical protein